MKTFISFPSIIPVVLQGVLWKANVHPKTLPSKQLSRAIEIEHLLGMGLEL